MPTVGRTGRRGSRYSTAFSMRIQQSYGPFPSRPSTSASDGRDGRGGFRHSGVVLKGVAWPIPYTARSFSPAHPRRAETRLSLRRAPPALPHPPSTLSGGLGLPSTARIERAHSDRARSASTEGRPSRRSSLSCARCARCATRRIRIHPLQPRATGTRPADAREAVSGPCLCEPAVSSGGLARPPAPPFGSRDIFSPLATPSSFCNNS
jgi:hypothetical protein